MTPGDHPLAEEVDPAFAPETATTSRLAETDGLAVLGRLSFLVAMLGLVWASFSSPPRIFVSSPTEHCAALYVVAFTAALAFKKRRIVILGCWITAAAAVLEAIRAMLLGDVYATYLDWIGDAAGVIAALAPMSGQAFRDRF